VDKLQPFPERQPRIRDRASWRHDIATRLQGQFKPRAKYDARSASAVLLRINMRQSVSARSQAHSWPRVWQVIDGSRPSVVEFATVHFIKELLAASVTKGLCATLDNIEPAARPQLSPGFNAIGERSHVLR